jgi:hypothetical protein
MNKLSLLALLYPLVLCTGCATESYSDKRLKIDTAELLGLQPIQIEISDKRLIEGTTYYTAKTGSDEYSCSTTSGPVVKSVMNMGISSLPKCQKKEERTNN